MIYYMCKYTPLEILAGFSVPCCRLETETDSFERAEELGHSNICGYGKALLQAAMAPKVQELVLVNCCDVVRRLYDILNKRKKMDFLFLLDLPHRKGEAEERLLQRQLQGLVEAYAAYSGREFRPKLAWEAWKKEAETARRQREGGAEEPYISLLGAHGGQALLHKVEEHFALRVRDDTCGGNRHLALPRGTEAGGEEAPAGGELSIREEAPAGGELSVREEAPAGGDFPTREGFWKSYTRALLEQTPCMRMCDISGRRELIGPGTPGETGEAAAGIIYHTMKFCDYYSFEYASVKGRKGIPLLKIETDGSRQSSGQLDTRLEAFGESLGLGLGGLSAAKGGQGMYTAGIDSGSASTDVVILDQEGKIAAWSIVPTGAGAAAGANRALQEALEKAGIREKDLRRTISTGYGRETIGKGDATVTEITCHARGAHYLNPQVRTIIDIGGQDSKVIRVDAEGAVQNFVMNDKCAAGTGRFLEMMARTMEMTLPQMSQLGKKWKEEVTISSMCTVFAESEVVSLIAQNTEPADIIHGLNQAVAARTAALVRRIGGQEGYMMTGGVARNEGIVQVLEQKLGAPIYVSEYAQLCGAIGAALMAAE